MDTSFFRKFAYGMRKLSRKVQEIDVDRIFEAARIEVIDQIRELLLDNLRNAIEQVPEFQYPELEERLLSVFSFPEMVGFSGDSVVIYAPSVAGDQYDWYRVLAAAKAEYSTGALSPAKALEFWTERVYKPAREGGTPGSYLRNDNFDYGAYGDRAYRKAIDARLDHTTRAPFWIWLEYGVDASHYPSYGGTSFVAKTVAEANELYRETLLSLSEEILSAVSEEVTEFFRNPEVYEPGQVLGRVEGLSGRQYILRVLGTRRLGVSLR
jgi:hypothetical protein